jgi:quercetin dioxygenase-like cupin family protein
MSTSETTGKLQYIRFEDHPVETVNPLLDRQLVTGDRSMLARIILHKGCIVPKHSHIDGREIIVKSGEVLVIPSQMPHSAVALEDTVDLDIFCPPRADWLQGTDAYLRK